VPRVRSGGCLGSGTSNACVTQHAVTVGTWPEPFLGGNLDAGGQPTIVDADRDARRGRLQRRLPGDGLAVRTIGRIGSWGLPDEDSSELRWAVRFLERPGGELGPGRAWTFFDRGEPGLERSGPVDLTHHHPDVIALSWSDEFEGNE
jgi:hypothetical protein